jgi:hypothetical protein
MPQPKLETKPKPKSKPELKPQKPKETVVEEDNIITTGEKAMSLSQLQNVAPKKFKQSSKKANIDTASVQNIISKSHNNNNK